MADTKVRTEIRFILNGGDVALTDVAPDATLLDWLRLNRSLRGTKEGCAEGDCGACTVLVGKLAGDGLVYESVNACIRFVGSLDGTHVVTVEHLRGEPGKLHPVQQAMVDFHGSQCGFCTPGFVMSLYGLWMKTPDPSNAAIEKALQGNLCRCTGYEAIMRAAHAISSYGKAAKDPLAVERKDITARLKALRDGARVEIGSGKARLIVPAGVDDFAGLLEKEPGATIVAGSTDVGLWVTKHMRDISPAIFIGGLDGLRAISEKDGVITIGAGVTYTEAFETLSKRIPALGPLVDRIGGEQVRNMGTIGGNIANGSPIGDTPPPLIALGAQLTLGKGKKRRTIPLETFFIAYGKQDRQPGEFVEAVHVPVPASGEKFAVYKVTKRRDEDITATLGAFYLTLAKNGTVADIRIAYGGMAATPKRATAVEKALIGKVWSEATVEAAMAEYASDFTPLTDMRASAEYRALAAKNLLLRFYVETTGTKAPLQVSRSEAA
ncbi:xanthine dehydrogenase small subunit [Mesorhizobium sp. M2A.F.Ca.ET.037.01.1.1]|uniref:xanthine dehydrogenase small subunit n=1 Tax=unclassified Mesorhizobium TaxID=325217 RepID=UPI000F758954|nr:MULTISPECIES: xanthine dehydrogenase small subunit [unclassified Mesorhizobium]RUY11982.1 xanthine dehydrogenase small subunit [Mesorhizobium sp. M2A.F.Ca.ET.040.01.1.1]RVC67410.1 xanthine dehydrogenase small subunit [Mesorhizobium sp. M00.F.Ca.ET.038.03.1.1]RVC78237.1 xanthine dehydrogenase small subunit [Mesorhizobium sp. M2A.F.Ca.ET.046.02.1.1]AZO35123.1 xanthine dehydrogenase small subunit [Mesorhizobium sp. M2A.F.Ca.ET.046.03.2.1]RUX20691.1 xanthine dehydrogenase small subunit [Mesorhi